jgi:LacI family transcriptional regulator
MHTRVTLVDVAQHAGVSRATASLVVRGSTLVAEETRARVQSSMRELGYVYHRAAATLRSRRSHLIGLLVPDVANPFYAELVSGVEERLAEAECVAVLASTNDEIDKQGRLLVAMQENNADGVLLCPAQDTQPELLMPPGLQPLPLVLLVRRLPGTAADYAGADTASGAALAVEHLARHGHRCIAFLGGQASSSARAERLKGFRAALSHHDLPFDPALTPCCRPTRAAGLATMQALLRGESPPSAVLCFNDVVAFGALLALQRHGLQPGKDLALIGFDDVEEAALWYPPLTSVAVSPRRLGREAAQVLLDRIEHPDRPAVEVLLPTTLMVRATCGTHNE